MKTRLVLILALALPGAYTAVASPRQVTNPVHRALEAQQQRNAEEQARRESMRPAIVLVAPSPNQVIGKVTRINLEQGFVVGWLQSRYLSLSGQIITRDEQLRTTAVLSVGNARSNRAAGLKIESGVPNIGDEIVVITATEQTLAGQATAQDAGAPQQTQPEPPPSLRPQWQQQPQPAAARPGTQPQEQQLIPAHRMRSLSGKPQVETRITVTVE